MCVTLGVAYWLVVVLYGDLGTATLKGPYDTLASCRVAAQDEDRAYEGEGVPSTCFLADCR